MAATALTGTGTIVGAPGIGGGATNGWVAGPGGPGGPGGMSCGPPGGIMVQLKLELNKQKFNPKSIACHLASSSARGGTAAAAASGERRHEQTAAEQTAAAARPCPEGQ